ncbi:hypothetical protein F0562_010578 [Nyssa sinensis]|uniref:Uncharacterized protein n=1 Tax=Nyssa sinensis TaxID=561372 RepID=A0A5J5A3J2_9ASTE|nr:hypothetical protein F0562_010578 [Nyssa sinensis]
MAKGAVLVASALCILAFAGFAHCHDEVFTVEGKVYCDTCRLQFVTKFSQFLAGATVQLECRDRQDCNNVTYSVESLTDANGHYGLPVYGDHEGEICEVTLVSSPDPECSEPTTERARVSLTKNSGITSDCRYANYLGFLKTDPIPECLEVLRELALFS